MNAKVTIGYDTRNKGKTPYSPVVWEFDSHTGKQKRYSKSFRLKVDAEKFTAEKTVEFSKGGVRDRPDDVTLEQFCKDWLKANRAELRASTINIYENTHARLKAISAKAHLCEQLPHSKRRRLLESKRISLSENLVIS